MSKWFGRGKNDHEASGSGSGRRRGRGETPPTPPPLPPPPPPLRARAYLPAHQCRNYWCHKCPVPWSNVGLPAEWRLSRDRVPVPPNLSASLRDQNVARPQPAGQDLGGGRVIPPPAVVAPEPEEAAFQAA